MFAGNTVCIQGIMEGMSERKKEELDRISGACPFWQLLKIFRVFLSVKKKEFLNNHTIVLISANTKSKKIK